MKKLEWIWVAGVAATALAFVGGALLLSPKKVAGQTGERIEPATGATWHAWAQNPDGQSAAFDVYVGSDENAAAVAANSYAAAGWRSGVYSA